MPINRKFKIILVFLLLFPIVSTYGQNNTRVKHVPDWQINYNLGFTEFYGDASNNGYFAKFNGEIAFATGATVRKYFTPAFGLGFNLWYTGLKSHKVKSATGAVVDFTLTGNYFDGNINLLVDFNSLFWGPSSRKFYVYGILGIGYGTWNTTLSDAISGGVINSGSTIAGTTFKTSGFVVPAGAGVNYMINNNWALNFEMNLRTVLGDDVDVWRDGFKYDQLLYTSIGISYFFDGKKKPKSPKKKTMAPVKSDIPVWDYRTDKTSSSPTTSKPEVVPVSPGTIAPGGVIFRVQILAKRNNIPTKNTLKSRFNIQGIVYENVQDGLHRFSTGEFLSYNEAVQYSYVLRGKGVVDAFVVAYSNNKRVTITPEMKKR